MLSKWLESKPALGIAASITGFSASVLALFQELSIVIGFLGAVFGLVAGYYTWRIKREHWNRIQHAISPARKVENEAIIAANKVHTEALVAANKTENEAVTAASKIKHAAVEVAVEIPLV